MELPADSLSIGRGSVMRHCVEKVLTLLQCCDIVATSAEQGNAKIC